LTNKKQVNKQDMLVIKASAGKEIEKVPVNSVPIDKTPADVGFNQTQYLNNLNQNSWKVKTQEYFAPAFQRGFKITQPLNQTLESNLINLLTKINALRIDFNKPMNVSSGFRIPEHNAKVKGVTHSKHLTCEAIDIVDNDGSLRRFCMQNNNAMLKQYGLFMEHPAYTKGWCHLQIRKPKSGNRVFIPYSGSPKEEHYDNSFTI
jgi:uncharacterized protein YcbK (DUF882 family)